MGVNSFVEGLLLSDLSSARKKIGQLVSENKDQLPEKEWLLLSHDVIDCVVRQAIKSGVNLPSEEKCWREFAYSLLQKDEQEFGKSSLSNEETMYQLLGMMGKCYVFGIYHGSLIKMPKEVSLKLLKSHFGSAFGHVLRNGFSPLVIEIHLPKLYNKKLAPNLNNQSHKKISEFLHSRSDVKGVFNANWYYDPNVGKISPNLAYLSEFASTNGAMLVKLASDQSAIGDATSKSKTRRDKYEKGEYLPTRYARFWPAEQIIKWAETV